MTFTAIALGAIVSFSFLGFDAMTELKLVVGRYYRLETISYFYRVEFVGIDAGNHHFSVLDEALLPTGQCLEFTEQQMQHLTIRLAKMPNPEMVE